MNIFKVVEEVTQVIEEREVSPPLVQKKHIPPKKGIKSFLCHLCVIYYM